MIMARLSLTSESGSDYDDDWLRELRHYWIGPYLTRQCWQVVNMRPGLPSRELLELGEQKIADLRYTQYRVIRVYEGQKEAHFAGKLLEFYPVPIKGGDEVDHVGYTPENFQSGLFRHTFVKKLRLEGTSWVLWMKVDGQDGLAFKVEHGGHLRYDPAADKQFEELLRMYEKDYLRKDRTSYFALTFLVYVDTPEEHQQFLAQWDPKHETCKTSNIPCFVCGSSPERPTTPLNKAIMPVTPASSPIPDGIWTPSSAVSTSPISNPDIDPFKPLRQGLLASLDTETKKGDVLDGDMDAILPIAGTPDFDEWAKCCSLLKLDPAEHTDPLVRSVKIPYTDIALSPRQYRTVFWMLSCKESRRIDGGILADVPGTGKTYTCLAAILLRALIAYNMAEVKREWSMRQYDEEKGSHGKREYKHLSGQFVNMDDSVHCPCGDKLGITCYANPGGQTRAIGEYMNRGLTLIQVPSGVIEEWKKALSGGKLNRKYFEPCVFHTNVPRDLTPPPNFRSRFEFKLTPRKQDYPANYKVWSDDFNFELTILPEPGKVPERYIVLTTHQDIKKLELEFEYPAQVMVEGKRVRKLVYGLPVGVQMVDEFHAVRGMKNPLVVKAKMHNTMKMGKMDFWAVTGTPLQFNIMDLESTIHLLHHPIWNDPDHYHHKKSVENLKELQVAYEMAVAADASPVTVDYFKEEAAAFFDGLIMRHTMDSRFVDQPITTIKEVKVQKISMFSTDYAQYKDGIQDVANEVSEKIIAQTGLENGYEQVVRSLKTYSELAPLQFLATFPGAVDVIKESKLQCNRPWLREIMTKKDNGENRDPAKMPLFFLQTEDVIKESPVLDRIWYEFETMENDRQSRPKLDPSGKEYSPRDDRRFKKMVIITPTLAESIFVYLGLQHKLAQAGKLSIHKVSFLHGDMKSSAKQAMTSDFQSLHPRSARILVTPFDVGGTGINLQSANYQILTGPLRTKELEKQAFARTNREGQQLRLHHFLFLDDDNPAHRLICARQAGRKVGGNPFDMGQPVELGAEEKG